MSSTRRFKMSRLSYTTRTEGQTEIHTINWTVQNINNLLGNMITRELRADKSMDPQATFSGTGFQLKMIFLGRSKEIIEIYYLSPNTVLMDVSLNISYSSNPDRNIVTTKEEKIKANKWQYLATLLKSSLTVTQTNSYTFGSPNLISHGALRALFVFTVKNNFKVCHSETEAQLSYDFQNLLNNGLFSDVVLKSVDGTDFKVHKGILASRSEVLKANFEHNTTECVTNVIESPFSTEVLQEVLTFIYSGKAPRVNEISEKLLPAADYYQLNKLKNLCEEALQEGLTVENAIETLQLADLHSAKNLKKLTLEFIKDGQASLVTKTEGWMKLQSVELVKTICEHMATDF